MRVIGWLAVVWLAVGCATTNGKWTSVEAIKRPSAADYPDAGAVILARDLKYVMTVPTRVMGYYQERHHELLAILNESGFKYAEVRVSAGEGASITITARTISPGGQISEVTQQQMLEAKAQAGSADDSQKGSIKVFRFPKVEVGSLLEYIYTIDSPTVLFSKTGRVSSELPTQRYHLELLMSENVNFSFKLYNDDTAYKSDKLGEYTRLTLDVRDVPASEKEQLAVPWEISEPWWAFRSNFYERRLDRQYVYDSWPNAMKEFAKKLYIDNDKFFKGADLKIATPDCGANRRCVVNHALSFVRDKTDINAFKTNMSKARSMKEVLASGYASNFEKTLLLWGILKTSGVVAHFAVVDRNGAPTFDHDFPLPGQFDHLFLHVPKQAGIADGWFVDPSCEQCTVGQLSDWIKGREALIVVAEAKVTTDAEVRIEFVSLDAGAQFPNGWTRVHELHLDTAGSLTAKNLRTQYGTTAIDARIVNRTWTDAELTEKLEAELQSRVKTARLVGHTPRKCDKARAECQLTIDYTIPGYADAQEDRLIVPLTLLASDWDSLFAKVKRQHDLYARYERTEDETLVFHLPPGYVADELPASYRQSTPIADFDFEITTSPGVVKVRRSVKSHAGTFDKKMYSEIAAAIGRFAATRHMVFSTEPLKN